MAPCAHSFREPGRTCPHAATPTGRCLWHSPHIRKGDAYVRDLITQALAAGGLAEAHLAHARLDGMDLAGRDLAGADLRDADLRGARLAGADLAGACLRRADLAGADLTGANLRGADLSDACLEGAVLAGADAAGSLVEGTDLRGADCTGLNLEGARIGRFHWNRRTRFDQVRGFEARSGDPDETQDFPAPLALSGAVVGGLADPDPDVERTRTYAPVADAAPVAVPDTATPVHGPNQATTTAMPPVPAPAPRRRPWRPALGLLAVVLAGGAGWWLAPRPGDAVALSAQVRQLATQNDATLAELAATRERLEALSAEADAARDSARSAKAAGAQAAAERDQALARARAADLEALRLHTADDRALTADVTIDELRTRLRELAQGSSRQESVARILAAGVERLQAENERLGRVRDETVALRHRLDRTGEERDRLAGALATAQSERDRLQTALAKAKGDLDVAEQAIGRYLARLSASNLQEALGDDLEALPMHPVAAGNAIALAGRYAMTLRVDPVEAAQPTVGVRLVLQRPAAEASPDVAIVLYDQDRQPLRRVALGFPHTDGGPPVIAGTATVGCDRFPRFARVIVTPAGGQKQASLR
ncbi:MAG: hypothetical protein RLZZ127_2287 [Planctomycetota bacterium]|jgi:uncharacterized protein YjbI with pentapeptide repeats